MKKSNIRWAAIFVTLGVAASSGGCSTGAGGDGTGETQEPSSQQDMTQDTSNTDVSPNFSCTGSVGTVKPSDGNYYLSAFGCWVDASGNTHTDPGDNCIPACISSLRADICAGMSGPACEEHLTWFTADAARYGCGTRVQITNEANGRSVVAVVVDQGPACFVERSVSHAVLDASGRVDRYLFGSDQGASDRALVHVVQVSHSTPLGPR